MNVEYYQREEVSYNRRPGLKREYEPWMLDRLKNHLLSGGSISSYAGEIPMPVDHWQRVCKSIPEVAALRLRYNYLKRRRRQFNLIEEIPGEQISAMAEETSN